MKTKMYLRSEEDLGLLEDIAGEGWKDYQFLFEDSKGQSNAIMALIEDAIEYGQKQHPLKRRHKAEQ